MILIHKATQLRCFSRAFDLNIFVHYYYNSTTWMAANIFTNWVMCENIRMQKERKILVFLDNATSHQVQGVQKTKIGGFEAFLLSNITLLFFLTK